MDVWSNEIKPFINDKFQSKFADIDYFVKLIDETLKNKKIIKRKDRKFTKMKKLFSEVNKEEVELKRTNSMTFIRPHSQTIDSKKTRDSSIKRKNSDLNNQTSAKNLSITNEFYFNKTVDLEKNKLKLDEEVEQKIQIQRLTEYKKHKTDIEDSIKIKNELTFKEFLNKIIQNDNYIDDNISLIYHFCQQCFCFIKVEELFEQITNCYENIKKNNSEDELNKLIEFMNVLSIEMIYYYKDDETINKYILYVEDFYYKLISDLIMDLKTNDKEKIEEENSIHPFKLEDSENNINNNDTENIIEKKEDYLKFKDNLINNNLEANLEPKENGIEKIFKLKRRKLSLKKEIQFKEKKVNFEEKEDIINKKDSENKEPKKLFRSSMPVRNPKYFSLGKNKVKDIIKEEDELNEGSGDDKRHKSYKSKKNIFSEDSSSSEEEKTQKK